MPESATKASGILEPEKLRQTPQATTAFARKRPGHTLKTLRHEKQAATFTATSDSFSRLQATVQIPAAADYHQISTKYFNCSGAAISIPASASELSYADALQLSSKRGRYVPLTYNASEAGALGVMANNCFNRITTSNSLTAQRLKLPNSYLQPSLHI
ncbi:uncharacterized protein LOC127249540 [Andrographis paniculata]|uniref:uncharacterized protein LOC127249540 n=1 Tax=Andrographis paniculata TaxID=175694 RepID=UPI0021E6E0FD|nr:uncharacterized protein LOC127249540 [Andrographis paniculata]